MKQQPNYCTYCGCELSGQTVCPNCGKEYVAPVFGQQKSHDKDIKAAVMVLAIFQVAVSAVPQMLSWVMLHIPPMPEYDSFLAYVGIYVKIVTAPLFISLAWVVPMTIVLAIVFKKNVRINWLLKVCTFVFLNPVAGVMMIFIKNDTTAAITAEKIVGGNT